MSRLKTRARKRAGAFHQKFGTAGVIIAAVALVAALSGTALAAKGALTSKQKKEVEKIAKRYAGTPGAPGADGKQGPKGEVGADGADGKDGVNVTFSAASEAACPGGGAVFHAANGQITVCNGEKGETGQTGFTETLPSGKTETGVWAAAIPSLPAAPTTAGPGTSAVSFNIPLDLAPQFVYVAPGKEEEFEAECPGSPFAPAATGGFACFYAISEAGISHSGGFALPQGVFLTFTTPQGVEEPGGEAAGTWAVTAE
jgi:hypothetical protein